MSYVRKPFFVPGNYQKYREISRQIRAIFHRYTDLIEPMSIDEAYLDVTENKIGSKKCHQSCTLYSRRYMA